MAHNRKGSASFTILMFLGTSTGCSSDRGGDVPKIRAALKTLPGVHVNDVVGDSEFFLPPDEIRAELIIGDQGRLILCDLTPESIKGSGRFILARVGKWQPDVFGERDIGRMRYVAGCPNSVDVAPESSFLKLVPFPLRSVADVVANYERLNALIESWPTCFTRTQATDGSGWIEYRKTPFSHP